jgi:transcriptional regulator with XRE-family HTH domain
MNQLLEELRESFDDEDSRYAYAEAHLNASVAAQIKAVRGKMSQDELASMVGTKQSGISRLESANYSSWKVETLRKLARAFGLRLKISFEEFGTLIHEIENFQQDTLRKRKFAEDPAFNPVAIESKPPRSEIQLPRVPDMPHDLQDPPEQPEHVERRQNGNLTVMPPRGSYQDDLDRGQRLDRR